MIIMRYDLAASWKNQYIKILEDGPSSNEDNQLAAELIDAGYANAEHFKSNTGDNKIVVLAWNGPTTKGRLFLDELYMKIRQESSSYKLKMFLLHITGWIGGILASVISSYFLSVI